MKSASVASKHTLSHRAGRSNSIPVAPRKPGIRGPVAAASLAAVLCLFLQPGNLQAQSDGEEAKAAPQPNQLRAVETGKLEKLHRGDVVINKQARKLHLVDELRRLGGPGGLSGLGVSVGVWDEGPVFIEHEQFGGRVRIGENPASRSYKRHSTHVAGTIGAAGGSAEREKAQGMAPRVSILSYDWKDDIAELQAQGEAFKAYAWGGELDTIRQDTENRPVLVTNHSYGYVLGWTRYLGGWHWMGDPDVSPTEDYRFGRYAKSSREFDRIVYEFPHLTIFVAAGNDRGDGPRRARPGRAPVDGGPDGYDTLGPMAVAKNVITIGAMDDLKDDWTDEDLKVTEFSNFGPADDGRIKPDLVANGRLLLSPTVPPPGSDNACRSSEGDMVSDCYEEMSGTSMGTPAASGIAALLQELAQHQWLSAARDKPYLYADELKAALIHTARRPGPGPRYDIGWGAINAWAAGRLVAGEGGVLRRAEVAGAAPYEVKIRRREGRALRVTLVWVDKPGTPSTDVKLDDPSGMLVQDLDLTVTAPDGETRHYPWSLNPHKPGQAATNAGKNAVDTVEQVYIGAAAEGEGAEKGSPDGQDGDGIWIIRVTAASEDNGTVPFALAISGASKVE